MSLGIPSLATLSGPLAVIALFWLAALIAIKKCRSPLTPGAHDTRETIKIIATKTIGWQSSLLIVEAEGQRFLLSAGRAGLTPIGKLARYPSPAPSLRPDRAP